MKKQIALLVILTTIMFGSINVAYKTLLVNATYVEGLVAQDTIWTLTDSPFILSGNVTVDSNATLTIEPGVDVRFGGDFSLIVNGRIIANGTGDKMIRFTTDDPTHNILWRTIALNGPQLSLFANCIIEYGTNGTTQENGLLEIRNTIIRSNSENGIIINAGSSTIIDCQIFNNTESGINIQGGTSVLVQNNAIYSSGIGVRISGGNQIDVRNNNIESNQNGLVLTGSLVGAIVILQNEISNNIQSGVSLEGSMFANTVINENNVSANSHGFSVSANTSTYIDRNFIWNNTVGISYTKGTDHQAHFNDIYENEKGMDLLDPTKITVNATRNYWGHITGPKHVSLNPNGEGNSVGGDGTSILFLPFLTHSFTYTNSPPTAVLWTDKMTVAPDQRITFVGTDSQDDGSVVQYFFDFNDATNSGWTALSLYNHSYTSIGTYVASLTVEDDFGSKSAPTFTTINVANRPILETTVALDNSTVNYNEQTWVSAYVSTSSGPVADASVTMLSVKGGSFEPQSGITDSSGYFRALFTAPNVTQTTDVRIIARASLAGYADGADYKYVRVLPPLNVEVVLSTPTVRSEESTTLSIRITDDVEKPVAGASLTLSCANGTLSAYSGNTEANGSATFTYTAPLTLDQLNVTLVVTASKTGYGDGQGQATITVEPRILSVEITPDSPVTYSEAAQNVVVYVGYGAFPIQDANVTVTAESGSFTATSGITDSSGNVTFAFQAPQVNEDSNITISATAARDGYVENTVEFEIAVRPRNFNIQTSPSTVRSGQTETLTVLLTCKEDETAVIGATVTIAPEYGNAMTSTTDTSGRCTFALNVPQIQTNRLNVTVTATRSGYLQRQITVMLNVAPGEAGFPWLTIILIAIAIAIVAFVIVVVVLIKKKVITVSSKEEGPE